MLWSTAIAPAGGADAASARELPSWHHTLWRQLQRHALLHELVSGWPLGILAVVTLWRRASRRCATGAVAAILRAWLPRHLTIGLVSLVQRPVRHGSGASRSQVRKARGTRLCAHQRMRQGPRGLALRGRREGGHAVGPPVRVEHRIARVQRVKLAAGDDAFPESADLRPGDVAWVVEGNHRSHLWGVVDVVRHGSHPALRDGTGDVLAHQAELGLPIVPLQLPRLGAVNLADFLGLHRVGGDAEGVLLVVLRMERRGAARGDLVHRVQRARTPVRRLLLLVDVRDLEAPILSRAHGGLPRHSLLIIGRGMLDVTGVVRVAHVVPLGMQNPRATELNVGVVVRVPPIPPRRRRLPPCARWHLIVRAHGVRVPVSLPRPRLRLRQLDVGGGQRQIPGTTVHRRVIRAGGASNMHGISTTDGEVGLVQVLQMLIVRLRLLQILCH
mmetsp:Transcript_71546/g.207380  ORF Transcript_71546/g.207380 Transcript_71546/m.207380 type:complete len:443 (-) Transcript_71546:210-1538(-)